MAATLTLRTFILPLVAMQMRNAGALARAKPEIERLNARMQLAVRPTSRRAPIQPQLGNAAPETSERRTEHGAAAIAPPSPPAPRRSKTTLQRQRHSCRSSWACGKSARCNASTAHPTRVPLLTGFSGHRPEAKSRPRARVHARRYDCHPAKSFVPVLAQAPLFICFYLAISRMVSSWARPPLPRAPRARLATAAAAAFYGFSGRAAARKRARQRAHTDPHVTHRPPLLPFAPKPPRARCRASRRVASRGSLTCRWRTRTTRCQRCPPQRSSSPSRRARQHGTRGARVSFRRLCASADELLALRLAAHRGLRAAERCGRHAGQCCDGAQHQDGATRAGCGDGAPDGFFPAGCFRLLDQHQLVLARADAGRVTPLARSFRTLHARIRIHHAVLARLCRATITATVLKTTPVRRALGLPPLPSAAASVPPPRLYDSAPRPGAGASGAGKPR